MSKKHLTLIAVAILALTLVFALSGCAREDDVFEGKYIVTFDMNGGTLDYGTSTTNTQIKYAYEPDTYVLDVVEDLNYKLTKSGYVFTGWYTSESCSPADKWSFDSRVIDTESLTLYAGWEKAIVYSYTIYYMDGENEIALGNYKVKAGEKFDDWRKYAQTRDGYTAMGFYTDKDCTEEWNSATVHPGGETDLDIPVYVKYITGKWTLVSNVAALRNAVAANSNVYLMNDIDCGGEILNNSSTGFGGTYSGTFEGNGYSIKNFTVKQTSQAFKPECSIFSTLGDGAVVRNVNFENVLYDITSVNLDKVVEVKFALLAVEAGNVTAENVSVSGNVKTNYTGELTKIESAFYTVIENTTPVVDNFTSSIEIVCE